MRWSTWSVLGGSGASTRGKSPRSRTNRSLSTSTPTRITSSISTPSAASVPTTYTEPSRRLRGTRRRKRGKAFKYYDSIPCQIVPDPVNRTTTLHTAKAKFNFVEFILRVDEDEQFITPDGRFVRCSALDLNRKPVATDVRMAFVKGTPPELAIRKLGKGSEMHVLGIPRIDLALVSWRARTATKPGVLDRDLPYEIIVVGVYDDEQTRLFGRLRFFRLAA